MLRRQHDMEDLKAVMARRGPGDAPGTGSRPTSLLPNLLEESFEYIAAVREQDTEHMYDELGTCCCRSSFTRRSPASTGRFDLNDVTTAISRKMIERHTHIFGSGRTPPRRCWTTGRPSSGKRASPPPGSHAGRIHRAFPLDASLEGTAQGRKVGFDFADPRSPGQGAGGAQEVLDNLQEQGRSTGGIRICCSPLSTFVGCAIKIRISRYLRLPTSLFPFVSMENAIKSEGKCVRDLTLSKWMYTGVQESKQSNTFR